MPLAARRPPTSFPSYAVLDGALLAVAKRTVEEHGAELRLAGYTTLVSLEPTRSRGFDVPTPVSRFHVLEGHAPTMVQAHDATRFIDGALAEGSGVVVNCTAGCGRAGTMLAAFLIGREALGADEAIAQVRDAARSSRYPGVPIETGEQLDFLARWARSTPPRFAGKD